MIGEQDASAGLLLGGGGEEAGGGGTALGGAHQGGGVEQRGHAPVGQHRHARDMARTADARAQTADEHLLFRHHLIHHQHGP